MQQKILLKLNYLTKNERIFESYESTKYIKSISVCLAILSVDYYFHSSTVVITLNILIAFR